MIQTNQNDHFWTLDIQTSDRVCPIFDQTTIEDLEVNATFTIRHFLKQIKLTKDQDVQLMAYSSDNLIKINAFIDSPYISKY